MRVRALPHGPRQVEAETGWDRSSREVVPDGVDDVGGFRFVERRDRGRDEDLEGLPVLGGALLAHERDIRHGGSGVLHLSDRRIVGGRERTIRAGGDDDGGGAGAPALEGGRQSRGSLAGTASRKELSVVRLSHARQRRQAARGEQRHNEPGC